MRPSWFLYLYSFRNESGMKKTFAFAKSVRRFFSSFFEMANLCTPLIYKEMALGWMSYALPGLAQTSLDLNPVGNPWNQAKNLQHHKKATSKVGLKKMAQKAWNNITPDTSNLSTSQCQSVLRRRWMPKTVRLNIGCVLTCLRSTSRQEINF